MLEHVEKLAETSALAISKIKFDKVIVWDNGHSNGSTNGSTSGTAGFLQNMVRMMPPIMQVMKDIGGIEPPAYLGKVAPATATAAGAEIEPEVALPK